MEILVWLGAAVTLAGLALLIWCILRVVRARRAGLSEDDLRAALQRILPVNTGALFLSVIGLMLVVVGILLS
ncbi:MAG: hypothetical protein ACE369_04605 [Roseovarius sp.]